MTEKTESIRERNEPVRLEEIKGIGKKTSELLRKLRIDDAEELVRHFPRNYDIYEEPTLIKDIDNRAVVAIDATVVKSVDRKQIKNLILLTTTIRDAAGDFLRVTWFNMPYLRNTVKPSMRFVFRGRIKRMGNTVTLEQPAIFTLAKYDEMLAVMQPVYALTKGISNNQMTKFIAEALKQLVWKDYLPPSVREEYRLCELKDAMQNIHFPADFEHWKMARERLVFDEFFEFLCQMKQLKEKEAVLPNRYIINNHTVSDKVIKKLPYALTAAQQRVLQEIRRDMQGETVMQRLVQGDVGCGKTIVAFLGMLDIAAAGLQAALMVPTEVLATQHYENLCRLLQEQGLSYEAVLLTGSLGTAAKKKNYERIASGEVSLIIGTHALFQEKVIYDRLGLVVIDEQHRFGVMQRAMLMEKGVTPHTVVMSATPIPRTLAMILYAGMDISMIDEVPAQRLTIKNCVVTKDYRPNAYRFIEKQVAAGRQAYVICPMVEESDMLEAENVVDYAALLREQFGGRIAVSYLHGKMSAEEKTTILQQFEKNEIQVLVSTTVVEVGINVPNATVMMVENAERFSLASLHQLRGRVGRGDAQSYCIFVSATQKKEKLERLQILNQSNDGFYIASQDLKLRGPGDFFGVRQSGEMDFSIADILTDGKILQAASKVVEEMFASGEEWIDKNANNGIVIY